jgi:outer membrane protein assembly factor BamB
MSQLLKCCRFWLQAPVAVLALIMPEQASSRAPKADVTKLVVPDRNLVNTRDKNVVTDFNVAQGMEKNVLWKAKLGKLSYAGPVVAGGKVFVGTNNENPRDPDIKGDCGVIMCFEAKTGKFLWQATHPILDSKAENEPKQGIASTPFVDWDRLYYVSNRCELVCADVNGDPKKPGKAKILWTLDMRKELNVFPSQLANSSPIVAGDLVYTLTGNGQDISRMKWKLPSPEAPSFIAVNKKTGKLVWKDSSPGKEIMEGQWASPAFAAPKGGKPQAIFPGGDGWIYSFEAELGKLLWKFNGNPKDAAQNPAQKRMSEKAYFLATPVVWEDRVYIGTGRNPEDGAGVGHFWCIDTTKTGDVSPKDEKFDPKDPRNKDSALVWHYGGKIVPPPNRGREIRFGRTMSTCAIHDGLLYISELDGYFHCLDARTGQHHWEIDLKAQVWASPYWVDGKVFLGNEDSMLTVFAPGKQVQKPLASIDVERPLKTPVVVADGVLYFLTDTYLFAIGKK